MWGSRKSPWDLVWKFGGEILEIFGNLGEKFWKFGVGVSKHSLSSPPPFLTVFHCKNGNFEAQNSQD